MSRWCGEMIKEEQFWMFASLVGAGFGFYLVGNGYPVGYLTEGLGGVVFGYNFGKHCRKERPRELQPTFREIHWREEYIRLKGWDNMTDGQRHVFSKEITSLAMGMGGTAMKKELVKLKAK